MKHPRRASRDPLEGATPAVRQSRPGGVSWAVLVLIAGLLLALTQGRIHIPLGDLVQWLGALLQGQPAPNDQVQTVLLQVRGPRALAALAVGAALAVAGAAFQGLFRNPLVSPDILGASAGAALGALLGIFFSLGLAGIQLAAFAGGLIAVALVYATGSAVRQGDPVLVLLLAGIVIGSLLGAGIGLVKTLADPYNQLPAMTFWLLGSLAGAHAEDLPALLVPVGLGLGVLLMLRWRLDVMSLPEEEARALGARTTLLRLGIVAAATLVTAASVAAAGIVGWVGLVVPHLARFLVGPSFVRLLPTAALLGGGLLLFIDTLARSVAAVEVPLGILTALLGSPFFIALLGRAQKGWQ